jgi:hypothetical protein
MMLMIVFLFPTVPHVVADRGAHALADRLPDRVPDPVAHRRAHGHAHLVAHGGRPLSPMVIALRAGD